MDTKMIVEMIGYLGSALVLISFLMSSVVKLRIINAIGGFIFAIYAVIIQSYPTALMNFSLVVINIYYLVQVKKSSHHYDLVDGNVESTFFNYIINYYLDDIKNYFPEFSLDNPWIDTSYIVCCDAIPAGIFLGSKAEKDTLEILIDYSTPTYRDCSIGKYLYSKLSEKGIRKLAFAGKSPKHESYLRKMGFIKEGNIFVKELL